MATKLAKEAGISTELFKDKTQQFRRKFDNVISASTMIPSDENDSAEDGITQSEKDFINQKVLGFQKDQEHDIMTEE